MRHRTITRAVLALGDDIGGQFDARVADQLPGYFQHDCNISAILMAARAAHRMASGRYATPLRLLEAKDVRGSSRLYLGTVAHLLAVQWIAQRTGRTGSALASVFPVTEAAPGSVFVIFAYPLGGVATLAIDARLGRGGLVFGEHGAKYAGVMAQRTGQGATTRPNQSKSSRLSFESTGAF